MLAKFLVFFLIWLPNESASCKQRDFDTLILVVCIFIKKNKHHKMSPVADPGQTVS